MQATHEEDPMASPAVQLLGELQLRAVAALRLDEAVAPEHDHGKKSKQWRSLIPYLILVEYNYNPCTRFKCFSLFFCI